MTTRTEPTPQHFYFRAGRVERGARYEWREGYSRVTPFGGEFPWLTKREAQRAAKADGAKAKFFENEADARAALAAAKGRL